MPVPLRCHHTHTGIFINFLSGIASTQLANKRLKEPMMQPLMQLRKDPSTVGPPRAELSAGSCSQVPSLRAVFTWGEPLPEMVPPADRAAERATAALLSEVFLGPLSKLPAALWAPHVIRGSRIFALYDILVQLFLVGREVLPCSKKLHW